MFAACVRGQFKKRWEVRLRALLSEKVIHLGGYCNKGNTRSDKLWRGRKQNQEV